MLEAIIEIIIKTAVIMAFPLGALPLIIHVERRGAAFIQKRVGPNRVGPFGLLQPLADVAKFMFKEEVHPSHVRPFFYSAAPLIALVVALLPLACIPIMGPFQFFDRTVYPEVFRSDMGIFFAFAASALGSYGILLAGWASNNKYTMLGALRACAQMVSYELSLSTAVVAMIFIFGTNDIHLMVDWQTGYWFGFIPKWGVFVQPVAAMLFLVGIFAESNRLPFDLAEGESEIVAGYHLEYSSMKFAIFFMAEYVHMIALSALFIIMFFGGYSVLPGLDLIPLSNPFILPLLQVTSLTIKIALMIWFFVWVRWTFPRFRYDQLMNLGWERLLPLGIVNLIITVLFVYFRNQ
ncbi:MAG: NADH-quinone oxidoreductase subunit NuoH [Bacteriovoracaceae bacterium]|nr:NADH-quinone oxidoreductase subunit NuoH [Bacteriovoracaceae bacterium]